MLVDTSHRPWPVPDRPWAMAMCWHDLLFAHWPLPADRLRPLVPAELELDRFEGRAWVGIVPFRMSGVRLRGLPPLPGSGAFPELNVRTYVRTRDRPGVWFFSLDAGSRLAVRAARLLAHLPYFDARMEAREQDGAVHYRSERVHRGAPAAALHAEFAAAGPRFEAEPGGLVSFLTDRYCLYAQDRRGRLFRGDIHHAPWPLQPARARFQLNRMVEPLGLELPGCEPLLHFARRLDVVAWRPRLLGAERGERGPAAG